MLLSIKTVELLDEIVQNMPVPTERNAVLSLIAQSIPQEAFIDNEFWKETADVPIPDGFVDVAVDYALAVGISPGLMVHELLNMFSGMVASKLFLYKHDTDEFMVARKFTNDGELEYEVIEAQELS